MLIDVFTVDDWLVILVEQPNLYIKVPVFEERHLQGTRQDQVIVVALLQEDLLDDLFLWSCVFDQRSALQGLGLLPFQLFLDFFVNFHQAVDSLCYFK